MRTLAGQSERTTRIGKSSPRPVKRIVAERRRRAARLDFAEHGSFPPPHPRKGPHTVLRIVSNTVKESTILRS